MNHSVWGIVKRNEVNRRAAKRKAGGKTIGRARGVPLQDGRGVCEALVAVAGWV